ncbi:MAG TPA: uroporphyrinogen decarboxylase family protein [Planctomycetota bacterium]|nr:uroporphyrinogen decarboxylase family protein [Planctomycetota bacterium]
MTNRERAMAVLRYQSYDRLPVVHFGFWGETLQKWAAEGHLSADEAKKWGDGNPMDAVISGKLGFDFNWYSAFHSASLLRPGFEHRILKEFPDGTRHELDGNGVVVVTRPGARSIPAEIEHTLKDRASWEKEYKPRLQWSEDRVLSGMVRVNDRMLRFDQGGLEFLRKGERDYAYGLHCGSLYGNIRNLLGVEGSCYLQVDDEALFDEIIATVGDLCYRNAKYALESGAKFDFGHFWEDICFKNGPLIAPSTFEEKVGPQYRRITELLKQYGIDIVSLDCDGVIDALIPTWFANGVNTMFPIEVGTWDASIGPWREQFGRGLRGVGGMNKTVFARDRAAIQAEVERLKPLVALGGYIPCPDHRIAPDAKWELVQYYAELMRETFA